MEDKRLHQRFPSGPLKVHPWHHNMLGTYILAVVTSISMISTIFFAWNSSQEEPHIPTLVAKSPERTILILNVLSQVTLHSLAEFTTVVLDATRWALAC